MARGTWIASNTLVLIVVLGTSSCDRLCPGGTSSGPNSAWAPPEADFQDPVKQTLDRAKPVIVLVMATPQGGGSVGAQVYGTYSTGELCVTAKDYLLKQNPAKFAATGVDFACVSDMYDVMPWTIGERGQ